MRSQSAFPLLPTLTVERSSHTRPSVLSRFLIQPTSVSLEQDVPIATEQEDLSSLLFGNPVTCLAVLAEVFKQTILANDRNETIDFCQIITKAAGGSMDLPVDTDRLNIFSSYRWVLQWNARSIFFKWPKWPAFT